MPEPKSNVTSLEEWTTRRKEPTPPVDSSSIMIQSTGVSRQYEPFKREAQGIIRTLKETVQKFRVENLGVIRINILPNKILKEPIEAVVERDGESFLVRTLEMPLYGSGEDVKDAVDALKSEIESLYDDLMENNDFTEEWLRIKEYLQTRIIER